MEPASALGLIPRLLGAFKGAWRAVTQAKRLEDAEKRIATLEASVRAAPDPRPICLGCGIGRIKIDRAFRVTDEAEGLSPGAYRSGTCEGCNAYWVIDADNQPVIH